MTILVTGSSGKTASRLASLLRPSHSILIASRSGKDVDGSPAVQFDWTNPETYASPYLHPQAQQHPIRAVFLVTQPGNMRPLDHMKPFIDTAKAHGVKRFVLLSAIREDETTPGTGQVHAYLKGLGIEWAVLRPTFFMENFSELHHLPTIRDQSSIFSAVGDGKISFVSTEDIAAVAYRALTDEIPHNRDYVIVGGELLTHDDAATQFTEVLGRPIRHVRRSEEQRLEDYMKFGVPESYARRISAGETRASQDEFAFVNDTITRVTGNAPLTFRAFIEKHKHVWQG